MICLLMMWIYFCDAQISSFERYQRRSWTRAYTTVDPHSWTNNWSIGYYELRINTWNDWIDRIFNWIWCRVFNRIFNGIFRVFNWISNWIFNWIINRIINWIFNRIPNWICFRIFYRTLNNVSRDTWDNRTNYRETTDSIFSTGSIFSTDSIVSTESNGHLLWWGRLVHEPRRLRPFLPVLQIGCLPLWLPTRFILRPQTVRLQLAFANGLPPAASRCVNQNEIKILDTSSTFDVLTLQPQNHTNH